MTILDLYKRMCDSQTILLYGKDSIFIGRFNIGNIPNNLYHKKVDWIVVNNSSNLEIYFRE